MGGVQEEKKRSKGQIKKDKERKRKESRSKKFSRQVSKSDSVEEKEEGEEKIREELQGTDKFEKVEVKIEDLPKTAEVNIAEKSGRQNSVRWNDNNAEEEGYEEGVEEGVAEDEGDWEWDYGEPWEEKQKLVFKPKSKENTE